MLLTCVKTCCVYIWAILTVIQPHMTHGIMNGWPLDMTLSLRLSRVQIPQLCPSRPHFSGLCPLHPQLFLWTFKLLVFSTAPPLPLLPQVASVSSPRDAFIPLSLCHTVSVAQQPFFLLQLTLWSIS